MNKQRGKLDFNPIHTMTPVSLTTASIAPVADKDANTEKSRLSTNEVLNFEPKENGKLARDGTQFVAAHVPIEAALQLNFWEFKSAPLLNPS
jgi:hypothetical protein